MAHVAVADARLTYSFQRKTDAMRVNSGFPLLFLVALTLGAVSAFQFPSSTSHAYHDSYVKEFDGQRTFRTILCSKTPLRHRLLPETRKCSTLSMIVGDPYTAVMIVPTGIGASIGGYAGDALPSAR